MCHDALPIDEYRAKHHLTNNALCSYCNSAPETVVRVLRNCSGAGKLWNVLVPIEKGQFFHLADLFLGVQQYFRNSNFSAGSTMVASF